jgi:ParB family chromosome partitioning protein
VPVVVKNPATTTRAQLLEWALVENLQRENLNPIEEASAYQRLMQEFQLTHDDIAQRVGKDRSTVANAIRLLKLPLEVRAEVSANVLSTGHARALLSLPSEADQRRVARDVISRGLSVRETETIVKRSPVTTQNSRPAPPLTAKDVHTRAAEDTLHRALGAPVEILRGKRGGTIVIGFSSEDDLQRLFEYLTDDRRTRE